ncbi:efflux transporter outer membrane subunit [Noviherbaspirillum sp.]|uniref:efflux transporter outer membrane subunit n=1 Tax=Noviherbaspirillum sp. TaxID=1926288 RepID=UPI002D574E32|nr:efflux transporter outer membrane subunit [Noviherbaspirillum sp.]HZW20735.1 efflux transporter outer membrane subunit [Noviherbaspirillum sp.]
MKTLKFTLPVLAAAVLSACSMAPVYQRPDAPIATVYPAESGPAAGQIAYVTADAGWREFFQDARLRALIETALANNRDLRTAALRIEEARAQYNVVAADTLPNVAGTASGTRGRTAAATSPTGASVVGSNYQVGLSLAAFELDFFGRVRSLNEAALSQYLATEEAQRAAHISLVAEVAKAYLSERALGEQEELARRTLASRESALKLAQQRFEVGASSALDLKQNEVLAQTARVTLATLKRQRGQAQNALTLLAGRPVNALPQGLPLSSQGIVADLPAGLPSDLLGRRPDIRASEQRLKASNANIGAARAAFFPRISLTAGVGTASGELSGLFDGGTRTWSFVPQLVLPIFDAGRNRANLSIAEVRKNIAVADYEKTIQVAFREVADALVARDAIDEQIDAQARVLDAQRERLKLAEQRYQGGIASSLDVLDAQRELFSAEQSLVQAQLLRLTNAVDLYRSLGGGLKETAG